MSFDVKGKAALVSGANRGIGKVILQRLLHAGAAAEKARQTRLCVTRGRFITDVLGVGRARAVRAEIIPAGRGPSDRRRGRRAPSRPGRARADEARL